MSPFDTLTLTMYPFEYIVYRLGHNFRFPAGELYAYSGFRALLELCFLVVPFQESVPEVPNGTPNNLISVGRECPSLRVACCVLRVACCRAGTAPPRAVGAMRAVCAAGSTVNTVAASTLLRI